MKSVGVLNLEHYQEKHNESLCSFYLPMEQEQFTGLPSKMLREVGEGQHPIVITSGDVAVGFFILHTTERVKEFSDNPHAMLLTAFSINFKEQGKGYAKQGLLLLHDFVRKEFPNCEEILLAVNHKNIPAQKLYQKVGFEDTGKRKMGSIGEQYVMKLNMTSF